MVITGKKYNEAASATYKVIYSLFLFPLIYFVEGLLVHMWLGSAASIPFAVLIIPLSYFTLFFFEWFYDDGWAIPIPSFLFGKSASNRIRKLLDNQRDRINEQVDALAAKLDSRQG